MKIEFNNNSVSGVNRKYRGFTLDIPGHSLQVIDVPSQYVKDVLSYLKHSHPAVICTSPVETGVADQQSNTAITEDSGSGNAAKTEGAEASGTDSTAEEGVSYASTEKEDSASVQNEEEKDVTSEKESEAVKDDKKKSKKSSGGKK